jgi:hypothetical protein
MSSQAASGRRNPLLQAAEKSDAVRLWVELTFMSNDPDIRCD